jgi:hypothetical protein
MGQASGTGAAKAVNDIIEQLVDRFSLMHARYAGLCLTCAIAGVLLWRKPSKNVAVGIGFFAVLEVLVSGYGVNPQTDPSLYQPQVPALGELAEAEPGRICGLNCLPPMLNRWFELSDVRGYDAADPMRYVQFLELFAAPGSPKPDPSAATYAFYPRPSPLADFLGLRYLILPGAPADPAAVKFSDAAHTVLENARAMPRVTVPLSATIIPDSAARLRALSDEKFDPRETVILEDPSVSVPPSAVEGSARIVSEVPSRVEVEYSMQSAGFLVLADSWDPGWRARVNDVDAPVLIANHAFRAVSVPAGSGKVVFTYDPHSFRIGLYFAAASCVLLTIIGAEPTIRHRLTTGRREVPDDNSLAADRH